MKLVVAVDQEWGIGNKGDLLARVRADLLHFKELTLGKTVILGSNTLATFPGGKPLKNRRNLVLSADLSFRPKGAEVFRSEAELRALLHTLDQELLCVIGGESIYRQMLPYCDVAHVTKIDHAYEADAYFPDLDSDPEWEITADSDEQVYFDITYQFLKYERNKS